MSALVPRSSSGPAIRPHRITGRRALGRNPKPRLARNGPVSHPTLREAGFCLKEITHCPSPSSNDNPRSYDTTPHKSQNPNLGNFTMRNTQSKLSLAGGLAASLVTLPVSIGVGRSDATDQGPVGAIRIGLRCDTARTVVGSLAALQAWLADHHAAQPDATRPMACHRYQQIISHASIILDRLLLRFYRRHFMQASHGKAWSMVPKTKATNGSAA